MTNHQKVIFYAILALLFAVSGAVTSANSAISHIFIVLPLVVMGLFLFIAGYYSGRSKGKQ